MPDWNYGDAYLRHPIETGTAVFSDGSTLKAHDITAPLPDWMSKADMIFTDSPWNMGNLTSFYTKADKRNLMTGFPQFYSRLFECVAEIRPRLCYLEIGKQFLPEYIMSMRRLYKNVTFYNSTYYHKKDNLCYIVRGADKRPSGIALDGVDEEDAINWLTANEDYTCVADLCMGRGLVALGAYAAGKPFVGTELNHKRLSVALERLTALGAEYQIAN